MTYVVLQPNSNTNPSRDYLVVDNTAWARVADGKAVDLKPAHRSKTYSEAEGVRDELNHDAGQ